MDLVQVRHMRLIVEELTGGLYRGICDSREETPAVRCVQRNMQTCGSRKGGACGLIFLERSMGSEKYTNLWIPKRGRLRFDISRKDRGKYSSQTCSLHSVGAVAVSEGALVLGEMTFVVESVRVFLVQYLVLYDAFDALETFWA